MDGKRHSHQPPGFSRFFLAAVLLTVSWWKSPTWATSTASI
ncbi:unnamed protein product [Phaeothamnion confervicola]